MKKKIKIRKNWKTFKVTKVKIENICTNTNSFKLIFAGIYIYTIFALLPEYARIPYLESNAQIHLHIYNVSSICRQVYILYKSLTASKIVFKTNNLKIFVVTIICHIQINIFTKSLEYIPFRYIRDEKFFFSFNYYTAILYPFWCSILYDVWLHLCISKYPEFSFCQLFVVRSCMCTTTSERKT